MTAAMGLNTSLIEDNSKVKKRGSQAASRHGDASDQKALSSPSFAVTQALVRLLAQRGAIATITRSASASESLKGLLYLL